jgi:hypothetical protein
MSGERDRRRRRKLLVSQNGNPGKSGTCFDPCKCRRKMKEELVDKKLAEPSGFEQINVDPVALARVFGW